MIIAKATNSKALKATISAVHVGLCYRLMAMVSL